MSVINERICEGDGTCLEQFGDNGYYTSRTCVHQCKPIPCPNFLLCGKIGPAWYFRCHDGLCTHCDMFCGRSGRGILPFEDSVKCIICLRTTVCIDRCLDRSKYPPTYCCIKCMRQCHGISVYPSIVKDKPEAKKKIPKAASHMCGNRK